MNGNDAPVELCHEVLRRLDAAGVLKDMVLVGSWCGYSYRDYFRQPDYSSVGVNAQPVRFLNLLLERKVNVRVGGISVTMPHPINFSLQKLIISSRRKNLEKKEKDRRQAVEALRAVVRQGEGSDAKKAFEAMPPKWRKAVLDALAATDAEDLSALLGGIPR